MTNKILTLPMGSRLTCSWVATGNAKQPLACIWVETGERTSSTGTFSSKEESGRMPLCA